MSRAAVFDAEGAALALRPTDRLSGLGLSPIRAMNQDAPADAISLGLGEPGWPLHPAAAAALAGMGDSCAYGPNQGLPSLREALMQQYGVADSELMVTAGSQAALFALFQAYAHTGSQVLVPDPGFLAYPALAALTGAVTTRYALGPNGDLDADAFLEALDTCAAPSIVIINHPGNPSGGQASVSAMQRVASACERRGVLLISDEVYRELYFDNPLPSLRDASDYGVVLGSASKALCAPGLRIGWALGPGKVLAPARLVHNYMNSAPARPSQLAAAALLRSSAAVFKASRAELASRWAAFAQGIKTGFGIDPVKPAGGFYYLLSLPERARKDPMAFCLRVRDAFKVIAVPGLAFGPAAAGSVRLSFAGDQVIITEGLRRLAAAWREA